VGAEPQATGGRCTRFALFLGFQRAGNEQDRSGEEIKSYPTGSQHRGAAGGKDRQGKSISADR